MSLVTDAMVSAALEYLAQNTMASAKAKADRVMAEHERKIVRARLISQSEETTASAREAWAESHDDYIASCKAEADAVLRDEYHKAARIKADAIIEAWRTENANIRAAEKVR